MADNLLTTRNLLSLKFVMIWHTGELFQSNQRASGWKHHAFLNLRLTAAMVGKLADAAWPSGRQITALRAWNDHQFPLQLCLSLVWVFVHLRDNVMNHVLTNPEATQTDADAEGLPHHPRPLVRNSTKRTVSETMAKRKEFCRSVSGAVEDLERKIQYINDALDDDNLEHRLAIENTLGLLKLQIAGSMARFENRAPE